MDRDQNSLRRFFHDLAGPLSALALQLESATRSAARGDDPSAALKRAREELERAYAFFEGARASLLAQAGQGSKTPSP